MKITKRQLKQIINEEMRSLQERDVSGGTPRGGEQIFATTRALKAALDAFKKAPNPRTQSGFDDETQALSQAAARFAEEVRDFGGESSRYTLLPALKDSGLIS